MKPNTSVLVGAPVLFVLAVLLTLGGAALTGIPLAPLFSLAPLAFIIAAFLAVIAAAGVSSIGLAASEDSGERPKPSTATFALLVFWAAVFVVCFLNIEYAFMNMEAYGDYECFRLFLDEGRVMPKWLLGHVVVQFLYGLVRNLPPVLPGAHPHVRVVHQLRQMARRSYHGCGNGHAYQAMAQSYQPPVCHLHARVACLFERLPRVLSVHRMDHPGPVPVAARQTPRRPQPLRGRHGCGGAAPRLYGIRALRGLRALVLPRGKAQERAETPGHVPREPLSAHPRLLRRPSAQVSRRLRLQHGPRRPVHRIRSV